MRRVAEPDRIQRFMTALAVKATRPARLYFTGGATAVLLGWRASTIDVDIHIVPDDDRLLRALPDLKEDLEMNVELACPSRTSSPKFPAGRSAACSSPRRGS
jgi:hypothetical protein